jgi:hypothetical protein
MHVFVARAAAALMCAAPALAQVPSPDALLVVDQHRDAIVERTIAAWPGTLTGDRAEALRRTLWSLRSDRLLAASLSPGLDGLLASFAAADRVDAEARVSAKALGSATADLVYTPLTPCRIADTRNAVGALAANATRTLLGFHATSFASQGGTATSCGIPNGVAALAMNVYAVNPSALGFIKLWASNQAEPAVSTVNYEPPTVAIATGALVPVNAGDANKFNAKSPAGVHLVVDVVGYFRAPFAAGAGLRITRDAVVDTVNSVNGSSANAVTAGVRGATIGGGGVPAGGDTDPDFQFEAPNMVTDHYSTIGGGFSNRAGDNSGTVSDAAFATVAGGAFNTAGNAYASVVGGGANHANGAYAVVGGGEQNSASQPHATVAGGSHNVAGVDGATVGGGGLAGNICLNVATHNFDHPCGNRALGTRSTIAGGYGNDTTGTASTIAGGYANLAGGLMSSIPGGYANRADGAYSFAGGRQAYATSSGCFVWSDDNPVDYACTGANQFSVRATGGVAFASAIFPNGAVMNGVKLDPGSGSWALYSDRRLKQDFTRVDASAVLQRLLGVEIGTWSYIAQGPAVRHIGPTSQDFRAAFGVGESEETISTVDAHGVALAAIQGLNAKLEIRLAERERETAALRSELDEIKQLLWAVAKGR